MFPILHKTHLSMLYYLPPFPPRLPLTDAALPSPILHVTHFRYAVLPSPILHVTHFRYAVLPSPILP